MSSVTRTSVTENTFEVGESQSQQIQIFEDVGQSRYRTRIETIDHLNLCSQFKTASKISKWSRQIEDRLLC